MRTDTACALAALALAWMHTANAVDRIVLEAAEVQAGSSLRASGVRAELQLPDAGEVRLAARVQRLAAGTPASTLRDVTVDCAGLTVREPRFACADARVTAGATPIGPLRLRASADYRSDTETLEFRARDLAVAGGQVEAGGTMRPASWHVQLTARGLKIEEVRRLAAAWLTVPRSYTVTGTLDARVQANARGPRTRVSIDAQLPSLDFTNAAGTIVGEKLTARLAATLALDAGGTAFDARFASTAGQSLAGPVLLDFHANPLALGARGSWRGGELALDALTLEQTGLLTASGSARVQVTPVLAVRQARIDVQRLQFPAAYASFLQLALATTDFGALQTRGSATASLELADDAPVRAQLRLSDIGIEDDKGKFSMASADGEINWIADPRGEVAPSWLAWRHGSAYGLSGENARLDFRARGRGGELLREARLPVFDGALVIQALALREAGLPTAELDFEAVIEPISMPRVSRAFGWPELQGQLAGRVPGLEYRNRTLTVKGDVVARVFDGTIVGRNLRLQDPLGPWPRVFADVEARRLDLGLVTRTFPIGSITGRLDGDLHGLELFNWAPVAFDGRLYTTPGDRSRHRINQKAVTSLSSIGGGGGGVTAALQSGVLRFFDEFNYDRIGLSCRLHDEVCDMGGIPRDDGGFYIVKGRGIPRIDVIGNEGRVDWPLLVSQIAAGMSSEGIVVK